MTDFSCKNNYGFVGASLSEVIERLQAIKDQHGDVLLYAEHDNGISRITSCYTDGHGTELVAVIG